MGDREKPTRRVPHNEDLMMLGFVGFNKRKPCDISLKNTWQAPIPVSD